MVIVRGEESMVFIRVWNRRTNGKIKLGMETNLGLTPSVVVTRK